MFKVGGKLKTSDGRLLVHNTCHAEMRKILDNLGVGTRFHYPPGRRRLLSSGPDFSKIKMKFQKLFDEGKFEICYDDLGFPDFLDFVPEINGIPLMVSIDNMKGEGSTDFTEANKILSKKLGYSKSKKFQGGDGFDFPGRSGIKWTWHHHQDGKHMMLIPTDLNNKIKHIGGARLAATDTNKQLKKVMPSLQKIRNKYKKGCK